jgi:nitrogen fixation/metabolism regulation signal transduction histidine kinase
MLAVAVLVAILFAVSMVRPVLRMIGRHAIVILGSKLL